MDNTCNYSDNWQPYTGEYDKFEYDIETRTGELLTNCYPNADWFGQLDSTTRVHASQVKRIRFANKPKTILNLDVSDIKPKFKYC